MTINTFAQTQVPPAALRWQCPLELLEFESTAEVTPAEGIVGQPTANEALKFGIQCPTRGQNIFVRGSMGTGRSKMVRDLLKQLKPQAEALREFCYVHNFIRPDHPRLLTLPAGEAIKFREEVLELADFFKAGLRKGMESEPYRSEGKSLQGKVEASIEAITGPFEKALAENELTLVANPHGGRSQMIILPVIEGEPVSPDQLHHLVAQGKIEAAKAEQLEASLIDFRQQLQQVSEQVSQIVQSSMVELRQWRENLIRQLCQEKTAGIAERYSDSKVKLFLDESVDFLVKQLNRQADAEEESPIHFDSLFEVNIVLRHTETAVRPIVEENSPTIMNLLGTVEPTWGPNGEASSDYRGIRAGAILNADQGYLILDAKDVLVEPGAWRALMRVLRTERLEIVPPELGMMRQQLIIFPEAIPVRFRVILIGDVSTYYMLDELDPDFSELFKVLADFDEELPRDEIGIDLYTHVLTSMCNAEGWPPFHRTAVAAVIEHGARIASRANKLTARFGRIGDIAGEAAFVSDGKMVQASDVQKAIQRTKSRASLPSRKFFEMVQNKTILLDTAGTEVGQINGLATIRSGPLTYGFPARITASIGPGNAGIISIEGSSKMSGSIHTKGFHILGGLLRKLLPTKHPLAFNASIAFEQSYGGIDGDSASAAEIICLLSALTGIPIDQGIAVTGAIDQLGHVQAIGGVNEKIEGFFDACNFFGLTGKQGVVIPTANAADLMLREDLLVACEAGKFRIYAVSNIWQALEIFTNTPAGEIDDQESYPSGSLLAKAQERAESFWRLSLANPFPIANNGTPA